MRSNIQHHLPIHDAQQPILDAAPLPDVPTHFPQLILRGKTRLDDIVLPDLVEDPFRQVARKLLALRPRRPLRRAQRARAHLVVVDREAGLARPHVLQRARAHLRAVRGADRQPQPLPLPEAWAIDGVRRDRRHVGRAHRHEPAGRGHRTHLRQRAHRLPTVLQHLVRVHDVERAGRKSIAERVHVRHGEARVADSFVLRGLARARERGAADVVLDAEHVGGRVAPREVESDGARPAADVEDAQRRLGGGEAVEVREEVGAGVRHVPLGVRVEDLVGVPARVVGWWIWRHLTARLRASLASGRAGHERPHRAHCIRIAAAVLLYSWRHHASECLRPASKPYFPNRG